MNKFIVPLLIFGFVLIASFVTKEGSLDEELNIALKLSSNGLGKNYFKLPESDNFDKIPQDKKNHLNASKVELGKFMFHETALAINPKRSASKKTYSCATCHSASTSFYSGTQQAIGEGGLGFGSNRIFNKKYLKEEEEEDIEIDIQPIRTPTILNSAYQTAMTWNGQFGATHVNAETFDEWKEATPTNINHLGFEGLESQAIQGLTVHNQKYNNAIQQNRTYNKLFVKAYPNEYHWERFNEVTVGKAIAAYERTVLANKAPFQKWIRGDKNAMSDLEKEGAIVFFTKANCVKCHTGPALSSMEFYALGMNNLNNNKNVLITDFGDMIKSNLGRGGFTNISEDRFKFKVPQLYNLKESNFYGHGSSFKSIKDVVEYKNKAKKQNFEVPDYQIAEEFKPLNLTDFEVKALTEFLTKSLYDADLLRYQPKELPTNNCFPNADKMSINNKGCVQF